MLFWGKMSILIFMFLRVKPGCSVHYHDKKNFEGKEGTTSVTGWVDKEWNERIMSLTCKCKGKH